MKRFTLLCVLSGMLWTVFGAAVPASAYTGKGYVTKIVDGDTFFIDLYGDGTSTPFQVRLAGIQAMEVHHSYTTSDDECHAGPAQHRLSSLIYHKVVTLSAAHTSSSSLSRPVRYVSVDGVDPGAVLMKEGHAIPWQSNLEDARVNTYAKYAETAAANHLRIWDTDYCGSGPYQSTPLSMRVQWDAPGYDNDNVNGEYMRVYNSGGTAMPIAGWWLRDSGLRHFTFPSGSKVPAHGYVTLYIGKGSNSGTVFHWNLDKPVFANSVADGGYLIDPQGDFRAHDIYIP